MTKVRILRIRPVFNCLLIVAATGLLAACGKQGPTDASSLSALDEARAKAAGQCFFSVGHLSDNDAELIAASAAGDVGRVEQAIDAGGNVNARDSLLRTPLFATAFCNQAQVTTLLLERGGSPDAKDFTGMAPLHAAAITSGNEVAKVLISKGANINIQNTAGYTPLHLAAATNQEGMVGFLLERGADAQARARNGVTAAVLAADNGHPKVELAGKIAHDEGHQKPDDQQNNGQPQVLVPVFKVLCSQLH